MPVFGFVLTFARDARPRSASLQELEREPGVLLGETEGLRLPIVLEIAEGEHQEDRIARWMQLPGVVHVDYAFADFEDLLGAVRAEGEEQ
jgi:hypothetical protein